jgi:glycosyltransferase involved in cell wall biosynthesis
MAGGSVSEPIVSVIIPSYNYGRFLSACIDGVLAQDAEVPLEVIAIDDGSSDDSPAILKGYAARDPRVRIFLHSINRGHIVTVNEGFAAARGRFVARIDSDDRYRPNFLSTLLPLFDRHPAVGFAYGDAAIINTDGQVTCERCPQPHGGQPWQGWALPLILQKNYVCAPTAIGRREAWGKHVPVWEGLAFNDIYFNMMMARDWHFAYLPLVVADYRIHGTNHHSRITLNKTEEPSLLRVLDWIFAHPESDRQCEEAKQALRSSVYAAHYLDLADKYFGVGYSADARRCYARAFRLRPSLVFQGGPLRRFTATFLGRKLYDRLKSYFRRGDRRGSNNVDRQSCERER